MTPPRRLVVVGTRFGQVYLAALAEPDVGWTLAGILARGSHRSQRCAEDLGVPLYRSVEELPASVDGACVVVKAALTGGAGSDLARSLLRRGIDVVQEHPVHVDELAETLRVAAGGPARYSLTSFYPHMAPVRRFIEAATRLVADHPVLFVEGTCGFQYGFSMLDIVSEVLGGLTPFAVEPSTSGTCGPFRRVSGTARHVPFTLLVQHDLDPADPDNFAYVPHRLTVGTAAGTVALASTVGPVVWSARPHFPDAAGRLDFDLGRCDEAPGAAVLGPAGAAPYRELFFSQWPATAAAVLRHFATLAPERPAAAARAQRQLSLCRCWHDLATVLGPPTPVTGRPPGPFPNSAFLRLDPTHPVPSAQVPATVAGAPA